MPSFRKMVRQLGQSNNTSSGSIVLGSHNGCSHRSALCAALIVITIPLVEPEMPRHEYATFATQQITMDGLPDIYTVQVLIVLTVYEWGNGKPYQAWIYGGMATRMMQLLSSMPEPASYSQLQQEIHNRTLWSCCVLDRLIFCGKPQPPMLALDSIDTHWPSRGTDFAFGQSSNKSYPSDKESLSHFSIVGDIDDYYALLIQGFDIWSDILKWIVSGGRRHPKVILSKEAPWMEGSTWRSMQSRLQKWRQRHGGRIRFPEASVEAHVSLGVGNGEAFAYINLVYHLRYVTIEIRPPWPSWNQRPNTFVAFCFFAVNTSRFSPHQHLVRLDRSILLS
jgi:hypothetical protein